MSKRQVEITLSDFAENFFVLAGKPFSLDDYPHMRDIYNTDAQEMVLKFSRQCVVDDQIIDLADGTPVKAIDLQEVSSIIGFNTKTQKNEVTRVKHVWDNGIKPSYKIKTRSGHEAKVTENHPFWTVNGWVQAKDLEVKGRVAVSLDNSCALSPNAEIEFSPELINETGSHPAFVWKLTAPQIESYLRFWKENSEGSYIDHSSESFLKGLRTLFLKIGVPSSIYKLEDGRHRLDYSGIKKSSETKGDHYYDEIKSIEYLGEVSSTGIEIEKTHNFLIDHIATKNTAKSTTLANLLLARALTMPGIKQLYTAPVQSQTNEFSRDKLEPVINNSPFIQRSFVSGHVVQNVNKKVFTNGSLINLRYALLNADKIRGVSADINMFDEVQDMRQSVIDVIAETMAKSLLKYKIYSGTPKRTKGTLANYWFRSTQNEYAIKSSHSGHWNILGPDNIGATGLIDSKSGMPLDLRVDKGQWVSTYSSNKDRPPMEGYRVCLLHFAHSPWVDWQRDVIYKMENTSTGLFYNETLGLEYDAGAMPISRNDIMSACNPDLGISEDPDPAATGRPSIMGIDYGPVNSESSFTCISILQERQGKLQVVYAKKFLGKEADYSFIHKEVPRIFHKWNCILLASDYGMGEAPNSEFRERLGLEKVISFQHLPTQKEPFRYNPRMRAYTLNKSFIMNKIFSMIKKGKILFPRWEDFEDYSHDFTNIVKEFDEEKNTEKFTNIGPDDFAHATTFASVAAMILFPNIKEQLD